MAYTTAKTWAVGELVTASLLNTYMRDNQLYFKDTQFDSALIGSDVNKAGATFAAISAGWSVDITPRNTFVLVGLQISTDGTGTAGRYDIEQDDGVTQALLGDTLYGLVHTAGDDGASIVYLVTGLSAGTTYTFTPFFREDSAGVGVNVQTTSIIWALDFI